MAFSDLLEEYIDLRMAGEPHSEWMSIDEDYRLRREYHERMATLLREMDQIVSEARLS